MSNYEVNGDDLYSSGGESDEPAAPTPKPYTAPQPPASFPSFKSSFSAYAPSFNAKPPSNGQAPPTFKPPSFTAPKPFTAPSYSNTPMKRPAPPREPARPFRRGMGRGREMTLPAHMTQKSTPPVSVKKEEPDHLSIIPEHMRERFLQEEAKKKAPVETERKRPSRRRRDDSRRAAVLNSNKGGAKTASFGLSNLLATTKKTLISLDPERNAQKRMRRTDVGKIYKAVSMTKDAREREERHRREEEERREEERKEMAVMWADLRERERQKRRELKERWRREETVAAGMRDAHFMARVERHLGEWGGLEGMGVTLRKQESDEEVDRLMTVEVSLI